jgi:uncharacterized protein YutE (UPF0331/DUF86 family)
LKQDDRYLSKVERFIKEEEFILSHTMKLRDMGLKVDDDAANIEKIEGQGIITQGEADFLKEINGVRNFIVHRYNQIDMDIVNEALSKINDLKTITLKVADY